MKETIKRYSWCLLGGFIGGVLAAIMWNYLGLMLYENEEYANKRHRYIQLLSQQEVTADEYKELTSIEFDLARGIPRNRLMAIHPLRIKE